LDKNRELNYKSIDYLNDPEGLVKKWKEHNTEVKLEYKNKTTDELKREATYFKDNNLLINQLKCFEEIKRRAEEILQISNEMNKEQLDKLLE